MAVEGGGGGGEEGRGKVLNSFRKLGRSCITLRDLESTVKIILGSTRKYREGAREIWALLFSGSKGALAPTPPPTPTRRVSYKVLIRWHRDIILLKIVNGIYERKKNEP